MNLKKRFSCLYGPLLFFALAFAGRGLAQVPPPYLRLSFDNKFHLEGTGIGSLTVFPESPFAGIRQVPEGTFVEGLSGMAFVPGEDLTIRGENIFPGPEGTLSVWIKPVNYEEDWAGGPLLTPGRIGRFFIASMSDDSSTVQGRLQVRLSRHDCCSGLHWLEMWPGQHQQFTRTGPNAPFAIWQKDKWRMLTVVWFKGERRVYFNGVRIQHGVEVQRNPTRGSGSFSIPAGSKAVDELNIWDTPLSDGQISALFYSQMNRSGLSGTYQKIPSLHKSITLGGSEDMWDNTVGTRTWVDSYSGMAAESRPFSEKKDTLEMAHKDGHLYIRYREPMPENYITVTTLLGAEGMLRRRVAGRDSNVWEDDAVEIRLTGDGGKTNYVLAMGAGGALYDSVNGDTGFNLSPEDWSVNSNQDEEYWTVEMKINLAKLIQGSIPEEWGFNFVRIVRQQGYARRQWSFKAGDPRGYGRLILKQGTAIPVSAEMEWSETEGKLNLSVNEITITSPTVHYKITPLNLLELFPEEAEAEARYNMLDMIKHTGRLENLPPAVEGIQKLDTEDTGWTSSVDYMGEDLALAEMVITGEDGKEFSRRNFFISGSQAVSVRIFNLPSRSELVAQVFLASETLAGDDVTASIEIINGKEEPVLKTEIAGFSAIMEEKTIDVSGIPVGPYTVEISLVKGSSPLGSQSVQWFKSGDPSWLNNDIGVIKSVPEPWTPVIINKDNLKVWGREHSFTNSMLPASMKILGKEILAGPIRLIIKSGDDIIDTSEVQSPAVTIDKEGIIADMKASASAGRLSVEMAGQLEFDGFGYFEFTFKPVEGSEPVKIDSIVLEVPLKKEYALLYDDSSYNLFNTNSGLIPAEGMSLRPPGTIRVGDTERGVQFYPVLTSMGTMAAQTPLSFVPEDGTVVMRHIISEGLTLDRPMKNVLGMIGTPVKPFDAKRIRMTAHAGPQIPEDLREKGYSSTQYWTSGWTNFGGGTGREDTYYNFSPEWCEGLAKSRQDAWHKKGTYPALYLSPTVTEAETPEYAYFWKEWNGLYQEGLEENLIDLSKYKGADIRPKTSRTSGNFWANPSYQDFYFYSLEKVLKAFSAADVRVGLYVDNTHSQSDPRPIRRWVQRLHQLGRKYSPDGLIIIHMSGDRRMAVWSMVDVLVEGEQYSANWTSYMVNNPGTTANDCYPTVLPLDRVRATYARPLWGPQQVFLSQFWTDRSQGEDIFRQENPGKVPPTYTSRFRHITGLMMVHDVPFWGEFYGCGAAEDPWAKRARWGFDETVEFIPYWNNSDMIEIDAPDTSNTVVSGWLKPDGSLMLIVFNDTDESAGVKLKLNNENFPVKLRPFTKAEDITSPVPNFEPEVEESHVYEYKDGILELDMRPRDFRLLIFK